MTPFKGAVFCEYKATGKVFEIDIYDVETIEQTMEKHRKNQMTRQETIEEEYGW